jgi:N-methylhydantoinase B
MLKELGPAARRPEVDFSKLPGGPWDGKRYSYIPHAPDRLPPAVEIFDDACPVDPVTYQVIRWKIWGINLEHADTLKRLSGTRVIVYADDFATSILTGAGDNLVMSPTIQYFGGMSDLAVNSTLDFRSRNPGIEAGDVFLQNDPYVGTGHQPDTAMYGPVFWEGKILAWVYNCCHVGDIGGVESGSYCVNARDIFDEPLPIPPIKIARNSVLHDDVVDMFTRQSRIPEMMALQIRSQMAGFIATRDRLLAVVEQYGPEIVAGVMQQIIADCSEAVRRRLESIPDGEWTERLYVGYVTPGDREVHPVVTTIRKQGDQLICANAGTAAQRISGNATYSAWRAALICAGTNILAYDQLGCPAGLLQHMRFEPTPGTFNCAIYPAAVTTLVGTIVSVASAGQVFSNMVLSGPESLRANARAAGGGTSHGLWLLSWLDAQGRVRTDMTGAGGVSGLGASGERDGFDQGGMWIAPTNVAGDIEEWEETMPMIFLYRSNGIDTGGPGRFRGGNGVDIAIIGHKGNGVKVQSFGSDAAVNIEPGLAGGTAGRAGDFGFVSSSKLQEALTSSDRLGSLKDIQQKLGKPKRLNPRASTPLTPDDVFLVGQSGSGGFGDPLLRSAEMVIADVADELVSPELAWRVYGVVFDDNNKLDADATMARRTDIRSERLAASRPEALPIGSNSVAADSFSWKVGDSLVAACVNDHWYWGCSHCQRRLAPLAENHKLGCRVIEASPELIDGDRYPNPSEFSDAPMVSRQYICPGCGTLLGSEFCLDSDPPLNDIQIDETWLRANACASAPSSLEVA